MTYKKKFRKWYDQKKEEGILDEKASEICQEIIDIFSNIPFWKIRYAWNKHFKILVLRCIIIPTELEIADNALIAKMDEERKYNRDPRSMPANNTSFKEEERNND